MKWWYCKTQQWSKAKRYVKIYITGECFLHCPRFPKCQQVFFCWDVTKQKKRQLCTEYHAKQILNCDLFDFAPFQQKVVGQVHTVGLSWRLDEESQGSGYQLCLWSSNAINVPQLGRHKKTATTHTDCLYVL